MKVGQIIRIFRFGTWYQGINPCQGSIWARVIRVDKDSRQPGHNVADVEFIAVDHPSLEEMISPEDWAPSEWDLDSDDQFEKVPPSKVPDWVWVEQSKRELSK